MELYYASKEHRRREEGDVEIYWIFIWTTWYRCL